MGFIDDLKHIASDINGALDKNVNNIGVGPQGINRNEYTGDYKQPVSMSNPDGLAGLGAVNSNRDSVIDLASTVEAGATGPRAMFTPDMMFDSNGQLIHRNPQEQGQYQNDMGYGQPCNPDMYTGQNMNDMNNGMMNPGQTGINLNKDNQ